MRERYEYLRLDGSTPQRDRQKLADKFNKGDACTHARPPSCPLPLNPNLVPSS
jgi:SNF2 family DNA or RNA helicase